MNANLTRISAGKYQHTSGAVIERRARERRGRNGYVLPGWAIIVDGRETDRRSTLTAAAEILDAQPQSPTGPDWVDDLMTGIPPVAPNPHYHCESASTRPCPTGEHVNPYQPDPATLTGVRAW